MIGTSRDVRIDRAGPFGALRNDSKINNYQERRGNNAPVTEMKIIELAHALGEEIAASAEIEKLNSAKAAFDDDAALQEKMQEYNAQRALLGGEFSKDPDKQDQVALADIKARMDELSSEIAGNERYIAFLNAKKSARRAYEQGE